MDIQEIQGQMTEHRHCDIMRAETQYRWDLGIHHVADKYNSTMGSEEEWRKMARARAAALIAKMKESREQA